MKIAICEDEEVIAQELWKFFFDIPDAEATCFTDPVEFLNRCREGEHFDILFCDVVMQPIDGIEVCRRIRSMDYSMYLVFITNYIEFAPKGYELGVFRYLLKPVCKDDVRRVLAEIEKDAAGQEKVLLRDSNGNSTVIGICDIVYAEIHDKRAFVHCNDHVLITETSMNELEMLLNRRMFYRIHRKYMVNMESIKELQQGGLLLDNGVKLPVSHRRMRDFKAAFYAFLGSR